MRVRARIILLLVGTWILTACGVKSAPRPPKPKPTQTSQLSGVPRENPSALQAGHNFKRLGMQGAAKRDISCPKDATYPQPT